jgi:DNA-binding response OmpR family regulator|nr:response regulator [uncultured Emticicia sp.]
MLILAADDQPMILKSIENKLLEDGFEVLSANNGQEAIDFFDSYQPDLAIIDLNMPIKSGYEVIDHIRTVRSSNIPIIIMSGENEEKTIIEVFNMGVNDYVEKPVRVNKVLVRVKRLLNLKINVDELQQKGVLKSGLLIKNGIGVVIPCYNEEKRLKTKEFANFVHNNHGYHICFVNDGSKDKTLDVLKEFQQGKEGYISIYDCEKNSGKAEAVRQGILYLVKDKSLDYIGFLDADLSTDFIDFDDLAKTLSVSDYKLVIGSRITRMGANIIKQSSRGIISKIINIIIRTILGMEIQDTQCGAKIMNREVAENLFNTPFLTSWLFDVEIFLRMKKYYGAETVEKLICEQPLRRWVHEDGSKFSFKDSVKILGQLSEIARKY